MATPRTGSFYANFYRAVRSCEPKTYSSIRNPPNRCAQRSLHISARHAQSTYQNRYGPAVDSGLPPPPKPAEPLEPRQAEIKQKEVAKDADKQPAPSHDGSGEVIESDGSPTSNQTTPESTPVPDDLPQDLNSPLPNRELDIVLSVPSPNEVKDSDKPRHPHLEPSPYEHHFDTYTLVQDLAQDAFSQKQATTLMKAVRLMLGNNLDLAKDSLVSKSDIENESYLFRAACSELRTTLQGGRFAENQRQRSNRAQLQHEFDILNQKVSQDVLGMREELKAMFNDRKMGLQDEKRKIDSKISELNYEITVLLNSEAKSEVEGLRWVLTRRAALAIAIAAFMTLSALQYYSIRSREQAEIEKRKKAAQKAQEERMQAEGAARFTTPSRSSGTQTEFSESLG